MTHTQKHPDRPRRTHRVALAGLLTLLVGLAGCGDDDAGGNDNQNNTSPGDCGDGEVNPGEQCDDAELNSDTTPNACRTDCRNAYCGDKVIDDNEACDDGSSNSDRIANACRQDCSLPGCGDGVIDAAEACDDGNADAGDGCSPGCDVEPHWQCEDQPSVCSCEDFWRGDGCDQCVLYVDGSQTGPADGRSWATAFPRVQEAVDVAHQVGPGCDVWVAAGSYDVVETSLETGLSLRSGVNLLGGFLGDESEASQRDPDTHRTILTGEGGPAFTRSFHVVTAYDATDVVLDGLTLTGAEATGAGLGRIGGGLLALRSHLTIRACRIIGNAAVFGAGLYVFDTTLILDDTLVSGNGLALTPGSIDARGGGLYTEGSTVSITDSRFHGNFSFVSGYGVALYSRESDVVLEDTVVSQNATIDGVAGGIYSGGTSTLRVTRCRIVGNEATLFSGGIHSASPGTLIESSLLAANQGNSGGALSLTADATIINSTIAYNSAQSGGGIHASGTTTSVINTILWGNTAASIGPQLQAVSGATLNVDHCLVQGGWSGDNLSAQPGFVDSADLVVGEGTWTTVDYGYDAAEVWTRFVDSSASWTPGALAGRLIQADLSTSLWAVITDNTATEIFLDGFFPGYPVNAGDQYAIFDLRLGSSSPAIDAGLGDTSTPTLDLDGLPRVDLPVQNTGDGTPDYIDMGAYERQP